MTYFKFGDRVSTTSGGEFMVIGPYQGPRLENDGEGPATWLVPLDEDTIAGVLGPEPLWFLDEDIDDQV